MALTNSSKGDEPANDVATDKAEKAVQEPTRTRTSQRKAATAAVNAMKEQALGARKADNEDDEGKPKRGGRGRPKANSEKSSAKNERKRGASTDEDEDDESPPKSKKAASRFRMTARKRTGGVMPTVRRLKTVGRPGKAAKEDAVKESEEEKEDDKAQDKADESNSEENASKTE